MTCLRVTMFVIAAVAIGCNRTPTPTTPSAAQGDPTALHVVNGPTIVAPGEPPLILGKVTDRAGNPLSGVLIEIVDGPNPGRTALTDVSGKYRFDGTATDLARRRDATIRASRNGLQPRVGLVLWRVPGTDDTEREQVIWMDTGPAIVLDPGPYTLTTQFDVESAVSSVPAQPCDGFPPALSSRTFQVTVRIESRARDVDNVRVVEGVTALGGFGLTIVGRFVEFEFDYPFEDGVPGVGSLDVTGLAPTMEPATIRGSSVAIPFHGNFGYCPRVKAAPANVACHRCSSEHALMIFTPR